MSFKEFYNPPMNGAMYILDPVERAKRAKEMRNVFDNTPRKRIDGFAYKENKDPRS